jgi:CRISPR-associated exonuclease Cas4
VFHVSEVRNAAYCGRQAYYESQREACRLPPPETRVLREVAYLYPEVVESPEDALREACEFASVSVSLDLKEAAERLVETRDGSPELWDHVAYPDREERYIETDRLCGTVEKLSFVDGGVVVSILKTGEPPRAGVWSSERVEAAAVRRLASSKGTVEKVIVEYPRVGAVREAKLGKDDERALKRSLDTLEDVEKGYPPPRTDDRTKCEPCDFKQDCGVETRSLLTRLRERFG